MPGIRKDIQGLRALAVALVVAFHLWPGLVRGGYVGVDVFFVISGFLITGHLLSEVRKTGTVVLSRFWARRIRRLLPAGFLVLGASLLGALILLPRSLIQQTLHEIAASALYVQNWLLAFNSVDTLATNDTASVAQHYWSLSVEEQFYVAWPILIVVAIALGRAFTRRKPDAQGRMRLVLAVMVIVFVASLAYSVIETPRTNLFGYYISPTRAWEFAAGGLLALFPLAAAKVRPQWIKPILAWVGLALIVGSALAYTGTSPFPGYIALAPVVGAVLLILVGEDMSRWSPSRLSRWKPAVYIGDISYSIYLWHWPLIVLVPYALGHELRLPDRLMIIVATVALAALTKVFIEDPVRHSGSRRWSKRPSYAFMAAGMVAFLAVSSVFSARIDQNNAEAAEQMARAVDDGAPCFGAAAMHPGTVCPDPFTVTENVDLTFAVRDIHWDDGKPVLANPDCRLVTGSMLADCSSGKLSQSAPTIALVGDSHAERMAIALQEYAKDGRWRLLVGALHGCTGFESGTGGATNGIRYGAGLQECTTWAEDVVTELRQRDDIDVVAFTNKSGTYVIDAQQAVQIFSQIEASGKHVVSIREVPGLQPDVSGPLCAGQLHLRTDPCAWTPDDETDFMTEAGAVVDVAKIDLTPYFCDTTTCHLVVGGVVVYTDTDQLTHTFARTLAPFVGAQLEAAVDTLKQRAPVSAKPFTSRGETGSSRECRDL